jgi:nucleotide-binding universal stress UspA family protein
MNVLLTTDGSPDALYAIHEAIRLLPLVGAQVTVVAVANPLGSLPSAGAMDAMGGLLVSERLDEIAKVDLEAALGVLAGKGIVAKTIERMGDPTSVILDAAHEMAADVIVVGSHGVGALQRWLLGSVTDQLAHRWTGALLAIPHRKAS